jgi:hypothetical protein
MLLGFPVLGVFGAVYSVLCVRYRAFAVYLLPKL